MQAILRSSEFWVSLVVVIGVAGGQAGLWTAADFDSIIKPALTYVAARVISKVAKNVSFTSPSAPPPAAPAK